MNITIISVIITLFIWGRTSKAKREKTQNSSWLKVCWYGLLSVFVGAFYLKTYQVTSIDNMVHIEGWRVDYNSEGIISDTISDITIYNCFKSSTYNKSIYDKWTFRTDSLVNRNYGSATISIQYDNHPSYIKQREDLPSNLFSLFNIEAPCNGPLNEISFISKTIPSLLPISLYGKDDRDWMYSGDGHGFSKFYFTPTRYDKGAVIKGDRPVSIKNGYHYAELTGAYNLDEKDSTFTTHTLAMSIPQINTLNVFSACDLSQVTYAMCLNSDLPVKEINFRFEIPIEIESVDKIFRNDICSFGIKNPTSTVYLFHLKFPTYSNLQLIRSLILTTIFTALCSLCFSSLYFRLRKHAIKYKKKHRLTFTEAKSLKVLLKKRNTMLLKGFVCFVLLLAVLVIICWIMTVWYDYPFMIRRSLFSKWIWGSVCAMLLIVFIIYLLYKYTYKIPSSKKSGIHVNGIWRRTGIGMVSLLILSIVLWGRSGSSENESAEEIYKIAIDYEKGTNGKSVDLAKASIYYKKAAKMGLVDAQYDLAERYYTGFVVPKDYCKAMEWYVEAANKGHADSRYRIGQMYYYGHGVQANVHKAIIWWRAAADQGHPYAQYDLGLSYLNGELGYYSEGEGIKLLRKAAESGVPEAKELVDKIDNAK